MEANLLTILPALRDLFSNPGLDKVAGGAAPRTSVSDALVETFVEMIKIIRPDIVLEVGAHDASFSCTVKRDLPETTVIAFEANPHVFALYNETNRVKKSGVQYVLSAVSDTNGTVQLIIPTSVAGTKKPLHNMMGSLNRLGIPNIEDEEVSTESVTLDSFLGDISDRSLAIWLDVEGAVDRVLAGAAFTMPNAEAVICEVEVSRVWQGQITHAGIIEKFSDWDLVPVLCDCQKKFQYNLILVKSYLLKDLRIKNLICDFPAKADALLRSHAIQ
jgi:FkbM family methyltransferase